MVWTLILIIVAIILVKMFGPSLIQFPANSAVTGIKILAGAFLFVFGLLIITKILGNF